MPTWKFVLLVFGFMGFHRQAPALDGNCKLFLRIVDHVTPSMVSTALPFNLFVRVYNGKSGVAYDLLNQKHETLSEPELIQLRAKLVAKIKNRTQLLSSPSPSNADHNPYTPPQAAVGLMGTWYSVVEAHPRLTVHDWIEIYLERNHDEISSLTPVFRHQPVLLKLLFAEAINARPELILELKNPRARLRLYYGLNFLGNIGWAQLAMWGSTQVWPW